MTSSRDHHHFSIGRSLAPPTARRLRWLGGLLALVLSISLFASAAQACIGAFGYTSRDAVAEIDAMSSAVSVSTTMLGVDDETEYIVGDVAYLISKSGPIVLNLEEIIFRTDQTVTGVDCRHYERGGISETVSTYNLRGSYQSRLDTFFAVNGALFQGNVQVLAVVVNSEVNNRCVEDWKIANAATYVTQKIEAIGTYLPRIVAGYGLDNTPGDTVSKGFPVNTNGTIKQFPPQLTAIGYWSYDIFNPSNDSHPYNLNADSWSTLSAKLDQALRPGQKTIGVFKAYCAPGASQEQAWGVTCPNQSIWKLGGLADNWRDYWLADPRNELVLAFHWTTTNAPPNVFYGTEDLPTLWPRHSNIDAAVNCSISLPSINTVQAHDDALSTPQDTILNIANAHLLANDEGSGLIVDMDILCNSTTPTHGTLVCNGSTQGFEYHPPSGFVGIDSFPYTIRDNQNATSTATVTVEVAGQGSLFSDGFDSGGTSAWAQANTGGSGSLAVTTPAALSGPYGLEACFASAGDFARVVDLTPASESIYRASFQFSSTGASIGVSEYPRILRARNDATVNHVVIVRVGNSTSGNQMQVLTLLDNGSYAATAWLAAAEPAQIEVEWVAGGVLTQTGRLRVWIDGALATELSNLDNDQQRVDRTIFGVTGSIGANSSGCFDFDQFESYNSLH